VAGTTGTGYIAPAVGPDPHRILRNMSNSPASWISLLRKLGGPSFIVSTACSSGAYALAAAFALIEGGLCDLVVAGAADSSLNYLDVQGFASLLALSEQADSPETACRPFDAERNGFVMGEGGGFLVLERLAGARSRGARIYAEMSLPGLSSEIYNILSPEPGGVGMAATMRKALGQAGLEPRDIGYVNAHGTSTALNDLYEAQALASVFGDHARALPVSSTKPVTGHCLAAAAGVEAVITCQALVEGIVPPTGNLTHPDPAISLDLVAGEARRAELRHVMSNAFAFGGHNGVCIFSRPQ
jgi:3-oxoacyl-[acyl-carrier-protein] synthase II